MELGGRTGECLEMVAVKAGNDTLVVVVVVVVVVVDEMDLRIARIEYLGSVYFLHDYLTLAHCLPGEVVSQTAHWLEPYWLSSAEIHSSTSYVNNRW